MVMIYILNGPNLNLLGEREPEIYGRQSLSDIRVLCEEKAGRYGVDMRFHQSNHEGQLVEWIQEARQEADALIINPAAYGHTSIAIHDALKTFDGPIAEVHLSNMFRRESFRAHSYVSLIADIIIAGAGMAGYGYCFDFVMSKLAHPSA